MGGKTRPNGEFANLDRVFREDRLSVSHAEKSVGGISEFRISKKINIASEILTKLKRTMWYLTRSNVLKP
jgi:hypothetical protein